jgi:acetyl esterase/lipase
MKLLLNRRQIVLAGTMTAVTPAAVAAAGVYPDPSTIELWPGGAPGAEAVTVREEIVERLTITLFPPKVSFNGVTLLIVPGGGYVRVVIDKEGLEAADWFTARGFAAAVLRYRLPADGWAAGADAPIHDAMRALRLLRQRDVPGASASARLGVMGFSAGGHLCARLITELKLAYARRDAADDLSSRPDFAALVYPVISTAGAAAHAGSAQQLLSSGVPKANLERYSPNLNVSRETPPTLLVHASDDASVPVANSLLMYEALRAARVRSELHVFDSGGHGFGLRGVAGKNVAIWPTLVRNWATNDVKPSA